MCDACNPFVDWSENDLAKHHMSKEWHDRQKLKRSVVVCLSDGVSVEAASRICKWLRSELGDSVYQKYVDSVSVKDG